MRSVKELQEKHVRFELECFDRIYLNLFFPLLNSLGGAASVICRALSYAVPLASAFKAVRDRFVDQIQEYAKAKNLEIHRFRRDEDHEEVARKALIQWRKRLIAQGASAQEAEEAEGVFFIGKAQEKVKVLANCSQKDEQSGKKWLRLCWTQSMVNQYYCYFHDRVWGVGFLKFSSYAPFNGRMYVNGHEWLKGKLRAEGIAFEESDNGLLSCEDPKAAQEMAGRFSAGQIRRVSRRWMEEIPNPLSALRASCKLAWELSVLQIECSLTQVWEKPAHGLAFFEQVIHENLDLGRPGKIALIFNKRITRRTPQKRFMSRVMHYGVIPVFQVLYQCNKLKQYFKWGKALRNELTINNPRNFGIGRLLNEANLRALRKEGRQTINRLLRTETLCHDPAVGLECLNSLESPLEMEEGGQRISALPRSNPKVRALLGALVSCHLIMGGFRARDLKGRLAPLLGKSPQEITTGQMTYHLRRLRGHGIIEKIPRTTRYKVTSTGQHLALFISRLESRLYREAIAEICDPSVEDPGVQTPTKGKGKGKRAKRTKQQQPHPRAVRRLRPALNRFDKDLEKILQDLHLDLA